MTKKCSVIPQVLHNGTSVDSLAFSRIWENAKVLYSDAVKARSVAKKNYYNLFNPSFKSKVGDWELLYKINNGLAKESDLNLFMTLYNSDKSVLESSIKIPLDINGEPDIDSINKNEQYSSVFYYSNENESYLLEEDQMIINRVISGVIIKSFNFEGASNLANLKFDDFTVSIKDKVIEDLQAILSKNHTTHLERIIDYIRNDEKMVWDLFVGYFKNTYGISIKNLEDFDSDIDPFSDKPITEIKTEIPKRWSDSGQMEIDLTRTVASEIRFELAKSVNLNFDVLLGGNNKFNLNVPFESNDIWTRIISSIYSSTTERQIFLQLEYLSTRFYGGGLDTFIDKLKTNKEFYNIFYRTAKLAIVDIATLNVDKNTEKQSVASFRNKVLNRKSKANRVAYDKIHGAITKKVSNLEHDVKRIFDYLNEYNKILAGESVADRIRVLLKLSQLLDLGLSTFNMANLVKTTLNSNMRLDLYGSDTDINTNVDLTDLSNSERLLHCSILDTDIYKNVLNIASNVLRSYGVEYSKEKNKRVSDLKIRTKIIKSKRFKVDANYRGPLNDIAAIVRLDYSDLASMSFYNSAGDRVHSAQYNSFFTDFFDSLAKSTGTSITEEEVLERFNDYINDPRLEYDNLLWTLDPMDKERLFSYTYINGQKVVDVNWDAVNKLDVIQLDGNTYTDSNKGDGYEDIRDDNWNLNEVINSMMGWYLIPTSDSGRIYGVKRRFEHFESMIPNQHFNSNGTLIKDFSYDENGFKINNGILIQLNNGSFRLSKEVKQSRLYTYFRNNLYQEFTDIQLTFNKIFDTDAYLNDRTLRVNDKYKDQNEVNSLLIGIEVGTDGSLTSNGKPAGRVFNVSNLVYIENGEKISLQSFMEKFGPKQMIEVDGKPVEVSMDYLQAVLSSNLDLGIRDDLDLYMELFFANWITANQQSTIKNFKYIQDDIVKASHVRSTEEDDDVTSTQKTKNTNKLVKSRMVPSPVNIGNMTDEQVNEWSYNVTSLNLYLNNHFNTVIFGNLLFGNITEYKNMIDWNKRVNQTIRNGSSTASKETYNMMIFEDVELRSNMLDLMDNIKTSDESKEEFQKRFRKEITTTNAIDVITDVEFLKRAEAFGVKSRYEKLVKAINENEYFKPSDYLYLVEQMKFFSYTRKAIDGRVVSIQNKNSTIILFKNLVKGTEKELLYDFMIKNNINDLNTVEGHKLPIKKPIKLHNPDGTLDRSILDKSIQELTPHIIELSYKDLRIQLETVPHLTNTRNTIATQLIKKTLDNLINKHNYDIGLGDILGSEHSRKVIGRGRYEGEYGVFELFQHTLAYNAKESALEVLAEFGAIENGEIRYSNDNKIIKVDPNKVAATLEHYFISNNSDMNIIKAVSRNADGSTNLPYHHPSLLRLMESVLQAKITNKVTHQKIAGSHLPIQPDMFNAPILPVQDSTNQDTHVTYTKEFLKESTERGEDGYSNPRKLRSEYRDSKGKYHPAQIVMNPHRKEFYKKEFLMDDGSGRVDINKIKEKDPKLLLVFGTRIPHEGDQSSFVGEIVGFIQDGTSTAITPDHLIMRTGWDFDIDTVYLYHYTFDPKTYKTYNIFDESKSASKKRFNNYMKIYHPNLYTKRLRDTFYKIGQLYEKLNDTDYDVKHMSQSERDRRLNKLIGMTPEEIDVFGPQNYAALRQVLDAIQKEYGNKISETKKAIKGVESIIDKHINGEVVLSEDGLKEVFAKLEKHRNKLLRLYNLNPKEIYDKYGSRSPLAKKYLEIRYKYISSIQEDIKKLQEEIAESGYEDAKEAHRDAFKKLNFIERSTREERNNLLIDIFIALHSEDTNFEDREKPNEIDDIKAASDFVNGLLGFNNKLAHPTNIADKTYFRNLNMNIATLKENSVAYDNILAIASVLKMHNATHPVPAKIRFEQIQGYDPKNVYVTVHQYLYNIFGKDNVIINDDKTAIIKNIGYINSNASKDDKLVGMDIQGQRIMKQRFQLTTNVLDAVKSPMVNLNNDTFALFAYLCSTPLSYYTDLHVTYDKDGNPVSDKVNRFLFPSLFIAQPAVQELARRITANNRFGDKSYGTYAIKEVESDYTRDLIESLVDLSIEGKNSFIEYIADMSKNYTLEDPYTEDGQRFNEEFIQEVEDQRRELFGNALDELIKHKPGSTFKSFDKFVLSSYLKYAELPSITNVPQFIEELVDQIKYNNTLSERLPDLRLDSDIINDVKFYISQLTILNYYRSVDRASADVRSLMGIFNVDKLGTSPTSSVTNTWMNNLIRFEMNVGAFEEYLRNDVYAGNYEAYSREARRIRNGLYAQPTIPDKIEYLNDEFAKVPGYKHKGASLKTLNGESVTSAVFKELFSNELPDYTKSEYPYLAAKAIWGNILSTKVFSETILAENPKVKTVLNQLVADLDSVNDDRLRYRLLMYLMNRSVSKLNFFDNVDYAKILSVPSLSINEHGKNVYDLAESVDKENFKDKVKGYNGTISRSEDQVEAFRKLNLANQINILKEVGTNIDVLRYIDVRSDYDAVVKNGYVMITIPDAEFNLASVRVMFKHLYNSKDELDRIVAENLIKYAFITNGLQFGASISKYFDVGIYWDAKETIARENDLNKVRSLLFDVNNIPSELDDDYIQHIHQANWNNSSVNPYMEVTYTVYGKNKYINNHKPTWKSIIKSKNKKLFDSVQNLDHPLATHLIFETIESVNDSKYSDKEYLTREFTVGRNPFKVIYKRHKTTIGGYFVYYPIPRTLSFEYGNSVVPTYNMIPIRGKFEKIASLAEYENAIFGFSASTEEAITKAKLNPMDGGYSENLVKLSDSTDFTIHVFDSVVRNKFKHNMASNLLPDSKTLIIDEFEFVTQTPNLRQLVGNGPITITVVADDALNMDDETINEALKKLYNSADISKIYSINTNNNKFVEVLTKTIDIPQDKKVIITPKESAEQFSTLFTTEYANTPKDRIEYEAFNLIKSSQANLYDIVAKLYNSVKHGNLNNIKDLEFVIDHAKEKLEALEPLLPTNSAVADLVSNNAVLFEFITDTLESMRDFIMTTDDHKFIKAEYYNEMIEYARQLERYNNFIIVAKHMLDLPVFDSSKLRDEGVEPSDEVLEKMNIIESYNKAVENIRSIDNLNKLRDHEVMFKTKSREYFGIQIIARTSNDQYPEAAYNHAVKTLINDGVSPEEIPTHRFTQEDLDTVVKRMLENNEDLSMFALGLDSARETFITLSDITGKIYAESLYRSLVATHRRLKRFDDALNKVYKSKNSDYNHDREQWFLDKFVTEDGFLVSEFDTHHFSEVLVANTEVRDSIKKNYNDYRNELAKLHRELNKDELSKLAELKAAIAKQDRIINEMSTRTLIKPNTAEYKIHRKNYDNLSKDRRNLYKANNNIEIVHNRSENTVLIYKVIPSKQFASKKYLSLTEDEKKFLEELKSIISEVINDTFGGSEMGSNFIPYGYKPTITSEIKHLFGISNIDEGDYYIDINGERQYYAQASMMRAPAVKDLIKIPFKQPKEDNKKYVKRVLEEVNKNLDIDKQFTSLVDIKNYNKKVKREARIKVKEIRTFDIANLMHLFIGEMHEVKSVKDFESTYRLSLITLASDDFSAAIRKGTGKDILDLIKSKFTGKLEIVRKHGKNTNAYKRQVLFGDALFNVSRTKNKTDQVLNAVLRFTSMNTMMFNTRSHIKNIMFGYTQEMIEAVSKEFFDVSQLNQAVNQFRKSFVHIMNDIGKVEATDFHSGIIKLFSGIYEDQTEGYTGTSVNMFGRAIRAWDNVGYLGLKSGEFFLQFNTLFAMLKSHKIVAGIPMTKMDYLNDRRLKAVEDSGVLSAEELNELKLYFYTEKDKNLNATKYVDHVGNWLSKEGSNFSDSKKASIAEAIKGVYAKAEAEFDAIKETMEDQFELVDGLIEIKKDSIIDERTVSDFAERVLAVNHSMHGIYNRIDRNAIQNSFVGELLFQFRKWQRPTFSRWFGAKYGKTSYSERTRTNRAGAFMDFWKFAGMPAKRGWQMRYEGSNPYIGAIHNIAAGYIEFLRNVSYYYNVLPKHQQANIRRSIANIFSMAIASCLLYLAYLAVGDDEDKMAAWWAKYSIYLLSALQTEFFETTRIGWVTFYTRTKRNIMPAERSLTDLAKFFYYVMIYPFQSDEARVYQRGPYKDDYKAEVYLKKSVPLYRQIQTQQNLGNQISYYQMYNPLLNLIGNGR